MKTHPVKVKRSSSSGMVLADLLLNAVGGLTLLLIPLLQHVDEQGRMAEERTEEAASLAAEMATSAMTIQQQQSEINQLEQAVVSQKAAHQEMVREQNEQSASRMETVPVNVVFLFDGSMSMANRIAVASEAIWKCGELLPRVTDLRVGILVYHPSQQRQFPLQQLLLPSEDGGASETQLKEFLDSIELEGGKVDVVGAAQSGMDMFSSSRQGPSRDVLVLVGDVAPGDADGVDSFATQQLRTALQNWIGAGTDRRFLALFSHDPGGNYIDYDVPAHRAAYQWLAEIDGGRFDEEAAAVFPILFETMFSPAGEEE